MTFGDAASRTGGADRGASRRRDCKRWRPWRRWLRADRLATPPYQQFHRAVRWFHRMKRKGLLPIPYGELALTMQEPKGFREEPKPKRWTPGGTAKREEERADAKAQHCAERLARWREEKATRVQSRVHKPMLAKLGIAPVVDD